MLYIRGNGSRRSQCAARGYYEKENDSGRRVYSAGIRRENPFEDIVLSG